MTEKACASANCAYVKPTFKYCHYLFNNAAFREDNLESLTLFHFFSPLNHVFDLILRNFNISKVLFSVQIPFNLSK